MERNEKNNSTPEREISYIPLHTHKTKFPDTPHYYTHLWRCNVEITEICHYRAPLLSGLRPRRRRLPPRSPRVCSSHRLASPDSLAMNRGRSGGCSRERRVLVLLGEELGGTSVCFLGPLGAREIPKNTQARNN